MKAYVILNTAEDRILIHNSYGKWKILSRKLHNVSVKSFRPIIYTSKFKAYFCSLGYKLKPKRVNIQERWCSTTAVKEEPEDYLWLQSKYTGLVHKFYKESSTNTIFNKSIIRYDGSLWIHKEGKISSSYFSIFRFESYKGQFDVKDAPYY